ncbi:MAG: molecular chaperone [Chitinophagaceae bacterium]|nr:MAG: molecular chaperone [Chitinophagaceae bacterium]
MPMKPFFAALLLSLAIPAAAMTVSPLAQILDQTTTTGSVRIQNDGKGEKRYQILVDRYTVDAEGRRVMVPATDLVFFPSTVITLGPGKIQTLRWKRPLSSDGREVAYQVEIREEPLDKLDAVTSAGFLVTLRPRVLLPWVFTPAGAKPALSAHHEVVGNVQYLTFVNRGTATAPLQKISYGANPIGPQFVLPGERLRVKVATRAAEVKFDLRGAAQSLAVE